MDNFVDISPNKDAGVLKRVVKEGFGDESPPKGSKVEVHYTGTFLDGTQFDSSRDRKETFLFDLGKGNVIKAWDIGIATMKRGERAILTCSPAYAYGIMGSPPTIPPNTTLRFDIEVINWRGEDLSPECDGGIERLQIIPGEGYATPNDGALVEDSPEAERNSLLLASYLNISLCQLKLGDYPKARDAATSALDIDPNNEKAFYRRGQALLNLKEPDLASKDFMRCLEINPDNTVVKCKLDFCKKIIRKQLYEEKKIYANMFDKFAKMDTEREAFERTRQPNVMSSVGEWGQEDREREPGEFEKENPDILLLNKTGEFKDM
ncbi:FK506-binding protein 59kD isoform X2 [Leptinotarsa decemlineata]|uniref:FK506-binding protein 59kD isoform X2 n=1 Tax=Leptinotarsa decemlineata TaxID=7539 RepID=UPI003D30BEBA